MMYPTTDPRHHQAYVALARSCLRDEGDNCAGGVVKNVYVRTTVRALVRTCVCTSVRLAEIMLRTSFASFSTCNRTFWSEAKARTKGFPYLGCLLPQVDLKNEPRSYAISLAQFPPIRDCYNKCTLKKTPQITCSPGES